MLSYTVLATESGLIEISALLHIGAKSTYYDMPSITFKNTAGDEIEFWDQPKFINRFLDHLHHERWSLIEDLVVDENITVTMQFFKNNRNDILELWETANTLGML